MRGKIVHLLAVSLLTIANSPLAAQHPCGGCCPAPCANQGGGASGWQQFWYRANMDAHRNKHWPQPFVHSDRIAVRQPFAVMAQNGCIRQNTITGLHFEPLTQTLTESGKLKVRAILTENGASPQPVTIVAGTTPEITAMRTDAVQQFAAKVTGNSSLPEIRHVAIEPRTWPAEKIDAIGRQEVATIPAPRLPVRESTTKSGG